MHPPKLHGIRDIIHEANLIMLLYIRFEYNNTCNIVIEKI
jgi:hypothetical protein